MGHHADRIRAEMESLRANYARLEDELRRAEYKERRAAKNRSKTEARVLSRFEDGHWVARAPSGKHWWCAPEEVLYEQATSDDFDALQRLVQSGIIEEVTR